MYIFGCRLGWAVSSITNCLLCRSRSRPLGKGELQKGTNQVAKLQEQALQGGARGGFWYQFLGVLGLKKGEI